MAASSGRHSPSDVVTTTVANMDDSKIFFRSMHLIAPDTRNSVRVERRLHHECFRDLIIEVQREGTFRSDAPADIVGDFFFGSVHHLGTWYSAEGALSGAELGAHFATYSSPRCDRIGQHPLRDPPPEQRDEPARQL
ncbi:hypothetical protein [Planotetraspora kaengkrachanensis]|nr:hypothetical protein [Planotetraspora kaengkrachanensis]